MKKQPIKLNALDRAIAAVAPQWAAKRLQARGAMASAAGGYQAGGYRDAMAYWSPGVADANTDLVPNLRDMRARSRDLVRNSPTAAGAVNTQVTNVVGSGLTLQARVDSEFLGLDDDAAEEWQRNAERLFRMWAESENADAYGVQTFAELQELAFRSHLESGDSFVMLAGVNLPDWPFQIALQVIEADRVSNPQWKNDTDAMVQGIERDPATQRVKAVHVCNRHPGAAYTLQGFEWQRVAFVGDSGRRNILHLYRKLRPGQTRGIPVLSAVTDVVKQLTRFSQAEVDAAVNSAAMAVFTKMDPEAFQDIFDDTAQGTIIESAKRWDGTLQPGMAVNLLPGEDITTPTPGRPNPQFDAFFTAVMRQIGMALEIPHEVLTKHFQASYSAARAALLDAWRTFRIRRQWLATKLCQPVYEEWLADAVASGLIAAPGFFQDPQVRRAWCGAMWSGDGPGALDPLKEAQAARERMALGITTLAEETVAYDGGDWESKHRQRSREVDERVEAGLEAPAAPAPGTPGMPGAPGVPATDPEGDPEGEQPEAPEDDGAEARRMMRSNGLRRAREARAMAR